MSVRLGEKETNKKPAVFLDRDGTIIEEIGFIDDPNKVVPISNAVEAVKRLNDAGYSVIVISNQSGVARGYFSEDTVRAVNGKVAEIFNNDSAKIEKFYYCPHYAHGIVPKYSIECNCRKPATGLVEKAIEELNVEPKLVIGDRESDIKLAKNLGILSILVLTGYGKKQSDYVGQMTDFIADDILQAVEWFLNFNNIF